MVRIMEGVRVLEVASWTYVPSAGAVLAEWGADVIKVEHPESGDPQRGLVSSGLVPAGPGGVNHMIELPNRGKRGVAIDLRSEEGRAVLGKLAATSDVFLTSFLTPTRQALRIDVDDIRADNPNIIYARGSGQGMRGPEKDRGGFDGCSFWYRAVADIISPEGEYPAPPPGAAFGDMLGGLTIAGGICAALFHRERTGEALVVDNSLLATAMWATSGTILMAGMFGFSKLPRGDRTAGPNPLVNTYRTKDGRFISLMMLQGDKYWPELVRAVGRAELAEDGRFADGASRYENRRECVGVLDEIFATRTLDDWRHSLADIEGVWAPVQSSGELLDDPQILANGYSTELEHSTGTKFRMIPSPIQFNEEPASLVPAPEHGEHTDEILLEAGYSLDEVIDLKVRGAIL